MIENPSELSRVALTIECSENLDMVIENPSEYAAEYSEVALPSECSENLEVTVERSLEHPALIITSECSDYIPENNDHIMDSNKNM